VLGRRAGRVARRGVVKAAPLPYKRHRFPVEIISHCVWLQHRFPLSLRDVDEMMTERGVVVSYQTIHQWCRKFGHTYANGPRAPRRCPGDTWHLDEVFIKTAGKTHYLWPAGDQHGDVPDILLTSRRDATAATRFFRNLVKGGEYAPRVLITDNLASYGPARRRLMPRGAASTLEVSEQPGRELSSAHPPPRAGDARVPLSRRGAAVPVRVHRDLPILSASSARAVRPELPPRGRHPLRHPQRDRRSAHRRLTTPATRLHRAMNRPRMITQRTNLTVPSGGLPGLLRPYNRDQP
jgi:putative transposase